MWNEISDGALEVHYLDRWKRITGRDYFDPEDCIEDDMDWWDEDDEEEEEYQ